MFELPDGWRRWDRWLAYDGRIRVEAVIIHGDVYELPESMWDDFWLENIVLEVSAAGLVFKAWAGGKHPNLLDGDLCLGEHTMKEPRLDALMESLRVVDLQHSFYNVASKRLIGAWMGDELNLVGTLFKVR